MPVISLLVSSLPLLHCSDFSGLPPFESLEPVLSVRLSSWAPVHVFTPYCGVTPGTAIPTLSLSQSSHTSACHSAQGGPCHLSVASFSPLVRGT